MNRKSNKSKEIKRNGVAVENSLRKIVVLPDIRSAHNVGSIFRTSDAVGVTEIFLAGCTPKPIDRFLRPQKEIAKTALGAENTIPWIYEEDIKKVLTSLKKDGVYIVAVECEDVVFKNKIKVPVMDYKKIKIPKDKNEIAFVFGNEVDGVSKDVIKMCDVVASIDMKGGKESLNVAVSAGIAMFRILNV